MGRRDAVQFALEYGKAARSRGAEVLYRAGWERAGNGTSANYEGPLVHHTVGASSPAKPFPSENVLAGGRTGLPGPLTNVAGPWCPIERPRLVVMAAHPSNNAGASGGRGTAPYPVTSLFNPLVWALEIDYLGTVPMAPGQLRAALIHARATCDVLGKGPAWIRAHAETSVTGKWDPGYAPGKTIDMAAFRRDAADLTQSANVQEDDDMKPLFIAAPGRGHALVWPGYIRLLPGGSGVDQEELDGAIAEFGMFQNVATRDFDIRVSLRMNGTAAASGITADSAAQVAATVATVVGQVDVDEKALGEVLAAAVLPQVLAAQNAKADGGQVTAAEVQDIVRGAFARAAGA